MVLFLFSAAALSAQVRLPAFISSRMVLQQNVDAPLWGWSEPGKTVTVQASWNDRAFRARADDDGRWAVRIPTPAAGGPYTVTIDDSVLTDVMIGEVWICSGQSNMQWPLSQTLNAEEEIAAAACPDMRLFYAARAFSPEPLHDVYGSWRACTPKSAETFSAVAYFFGRELHRELGVPVGLIHTSWGGTPAEAWTRHDVLSSDADLRIYLERFAKKIAEAEPGMLPLNQGSPASLYNAMLHPFIPYGIRGAIWYQGEANILDADIYEILFSAMIGNWRRDWGQGEFPFYFVQLAPYEYATPLAGAALRDAQRRTLRVPNTGMAVTMDIGNPDDIHPRNKRDVGKRLALWALANTYGRSGMVFSGPLYRSMEKDGGRIRLFFDHTGGGLRSRAGELTHFEIAGANREFVPAEARIDGATILVSSDSVEHPLAVRYAFHNADEPNLVNAEELPASSFRTDDWPIVTDPVVLSIRFDAGSGLLKVTMRTEDPGLLIRYTLDGSVPGVSAPVYGDTLRLSEVSVVRARAFKGEFPSAAVREIRFTRHLATGKPIDIIHPWSPRYAAGGPGALVDGIEGGSNFNDGRWQGFQQNNMEAVIDLGAMAAIDTVSVHFLKNIDSWIFLPKSVRFLVSADGTAWQSLGEIVTDPALNLSGSSRQLYELQARAVRARYLKVTAYNTGECPEWHPGAGGKAWLFADEIIVRGGESPLP